MRGNYVTLTSAHGEYVSMYAKRRVLRTDCTCRGLRISVKYSRAWLLRLCEKSPLLRRRGIKHK